MNLIGLASSVTIPEADAAATEGLIGVDGPEWALLPPEITLTLGFDLPTRDDVISGWEWSVWLEPL